MTYYHVAFQSFYTTPPETSSSDPSTRRSKFRQNLPCSLSAISIAPILSPQPLLEFSSSIYIVGKESASSDVSRAVTRSLKVSTTLATRHTRRPATYWHYLLTSSAASALVARLLTSPTDVIIQSTPSQLASASVDLVHWLLTWPCIDRWLWLRVDLLQSRCSLPNFSRRFHFCRPFLHILLLNQE